MPAKDKESMVVIRMPLEMRQRLNSAYPQKVQKKLSSMIKDLLNGREQSLSVNWEKAESDDPRFRYQWELVATRSSSRVVVAVAHLNGVYEMGAGDGGYSVETFIEKNVDEAKKAASLAAIERGFLKF